MRKGHLSRDLTVGKKGVDGVTGRTVTSRENSNMKTPDMGTSWAGAGLDQESWCGQT